MYILGDLFEYWLGDDAGLNQYTEAVAALRQLNQHECGLTVMLGNRDFLLGNDFANACSATLVTNDELVIQSGNTSALLMHGDTLCTGDSDYLHFRSMVRNSQWQTEFLALSVDERISKAQAMRAASKDAGSGKSISIMDVTETAVLERMQATACNTLIHGHTHRPAKHTIDVNNATRWVVGDWHPDHAQYVQWDEDGIQLKTFG